MLRIVSIVMIVSLVAFSAIIQENDYGNALRTYRENQLDSSHWYIDRAIYRYAEAHKTDSLVLARVQKSLLIWETQGLDKAMRYMDTTLTLASLLAKDDIARVASLSRMGRLYLQRHEFSQATQHLQQAEQAVKPSVDHTQYVTLYNNLAILYLQQEQYGHARQYCDLAYQMNMRLEGKDGHSMANILQIRYLISNYMGDYTQALKDGAEFQHVMLLHYPADHPSIGSMHNSLATIYETLRSYDDAMYHRQKAVSTGFASYTKKHDSFSLAVAYQDLGNLYSYIHEPFLAQEYLEKGSRLLEKTYGKDGFGMVKPLVDLAVNKYKSSKFGEAELFFERALGIQQHHTPDDLLGLAYIEGFMAMMYLDQQQFDKTIVICNLVLDRYKRTNTLDTEDARHIYRTLAQALSALGQHQEALDIQLSLLPKYRKNYPKGNDAIAYQLHSISQTYLAMGNPVKALSYSDRTICEILGDDHLHADPAHWVGRLPYSFHTLLYIGERTKILYQLHTLSQDHRALPDVLSLTDAYTNFISTHLHSFRTQSALIDLTDINKNIYSIAMEACWLLSQNRDTERHKQLAFAYAEQSKALLMRLMANGASWNPEENDPIRTRDQQFRKEISHLNLQYLNDRNSDSLLTELSQRIEVYQHFQDSLKNSGHPLFSQKYDTGLPSLEQIRKTLLKNKETLVEFAVTEQSIFTFVLTSDSFHVLRSGKGVLQDVAVLRDLHGLDASTFAHASYRLYTALIQPIEAYLPSKRVFIVPDADLYYLNFEVLISHPNTSSFAQMPYLIRSYDFSHLLSASSAIKFKENQYRTKKEKKALLFAPVFTDEMKNSYRNSFPDEALIDKDYLYLYRQPFTLEASKGIGKLLSHDLYAEQEAEESVFKQVAPHYKILHLGTHAEVNNQSPLHSWFYLAKSMLTDSLNMEDGYLHTYEIYSMQLRAELAVLTACETGAGTWRNGEGVTSLAHGFMYAGCPSVVMSLWKIDEKSGSELITGFYRYLTNGKDKSEALKKAKIDLIHAHNERLAHPYYWAGFMLVGDTEPIYPDNRLWTFWFIAGGIVFFICLSALLLKRVKFIIKNKTWLSRRKPGGAV